MKNTLLILLSIGLLLLSGCSSSAYKNIQGTTTNPSQSTNEKIVEDLYGRKVSIPENVKTIAAVGGAARILTYAGAADLIVGVTEMDKKNVTGMPYSVVNAEHFAKVKSVGSGGSNDTTFIEELVTLKPDVIIGLVGNSETLEDISEKTKIPTLGLEVDNMFDESFYKSLELIGEVVNRVEHSQKVIQYVKDCQIDLGNRTKNIADADKPSVYAGAVSYRGAHGFEGSYGKYPPFVAVNAKNVVDETNTEGFLLIDLEKIILWNPDIIFLNPLNMNLVNENYEKNKSFYDNLDAVKNGEIYTQLPYNYNWSNLEIAIADAYYAGKTIFPQQFEDIDPVEKAEEIFTVMLGEKFYDKLESDGLKFEKIKIGG